MSAPAVADWRERILRGLGAPTSPQNLAFLTAWQAAEGGTASNNPFNTTLAYGTGWTNYNAGGVKNYPLPAQGIEATIKTLQESGHGYERILSDLEGSADPAVTAAAVVASEWGTRTFPTIGELPNASSPAADAPGGGAIAGCLTSLMVMIGASAFAGAGVAVLVRCLT